MSELRIQDWFRLGMKREIATFLPPGKRVLELGTRNAKVLVPGATALPDEWRAPSPIPFSDGSLDTIFAHHFFEHLSGADAVSTLRECERVLAPGGAVNIVVPYYSSQLAAQDLDHKSAWTEQTFATVFRNSYYGDYGEWRLRERGVMILGIVERNLALFAQLERQP